MKLAKEMDKLILFVVISIFLKRSTSLLIDYDSMLEQNLYAGDVAGLLTMA